MTIKKVFITGANGYIGGTIAHLLLKKGYEVTGLVRQPELAAELEALGMRAVTGSIDDAGLVSREAQMADAVINTATVLDPFFIDTVIDALKNTGKTFIHTTGSSILGDKALGEKSDFIYNEDVPQIPHLARTLWVALNDHVLLASKEGIRSMVIAPTMVYGKGLGLRKETIQLPLLHRLAHEKGMGVQVENGENIWSNIHIEDLGDFYVKMLENGIAGGLYYAENGEASLKDIAKEISRKMGKGEETFSIPIDEAVSFFGNADMVHFGLASNSRCTSLKARQTLGWQPKYNSILDYVYEV
ncbi:MAG: NAD-dependent epimerase/dehydratase family protein [Pedobacter sp.]|uniref:NAD-dependent epimerase/dehydratase family protein n=1 Tax=Pedobacter sp. TaxID=1411316 RepID=UPI0033938601